MTTNCTRRAISLFCLLLFVFLVSDRIEAQVVLDTLNSNNGKKTFPCPTSQTFTDDNTTNGLYFDGKARKDTIILCPSSNSFQIKVTFNSFDLANGDVLRVYDCDLSKTTCAASQTATGSGVSKAFGGWVTANCDPAVNNSGCLSFEFETNGDQIKGNGWSAQITCESDAVRIQCPATISVVDDCNNLDGMVTVTIPKPTFSTCNGTSNAMVNITSNCTSITGGTVLANGGTLGTFTIPLGTYTITATSVADPTKSCSYLVVADQPSISCNDNLTSTIGFNCSASVTVDDIIENPCVGPGTSYIIEMDLGGKIGKKSVEVSGTSLSTLSNGRLELSREDFNCGSEYGVMVTRKVSFTGCGGITSLTRSCSGRIRFVDNSAPSIFVTAPTLTTCGELTDEEVRSKLDIRVTDNCDVKDTTVTIGAFPSNFCGNNLSVSVTITAVDFCGNSNTETVNVSINRPTKFFQPADTVLPCGSGYGPEIAGYPLLDTDGDNVGDLPIKENTCNFIPIYTDQEVTADNSKTKKIFRTWQVKDWCDDLVPVTLPVQLIEVKDTGRPSINCPSGSQTGTKNNPHIVSTGTGDCTASLNIPRPGASDACDGSSLTVEYLRTVNIADETIINNISADLEVGKYYAEYYAQDGTGNRSDTCQIYFDVRDNGAPAALCTDELNVAFVNGQARISVDDIDIGSGDNCGVKAREIRKDGGSWAQEVTITCAETTNGAKIYLRITDVNGSSNTCWTTITGADYTAPQCSTLSDRTVNCEDFHTDDLGASTDTDEDRLFDAGEWQPLTGTLLSTYNNEFGTPDCMHASSCGTVTVEQQYQLIIANCGETSIKRRYRAYSSQNYSEWKEQNINLIFEEDFTLTFPEDWSGECGANIPEPELLLDAKGCNILAWTYEDKQFEGPDGVCLRVERTYSVTNWCLYQAGDPAFVISRIEDEHGFAGQRVIDHTSIGNAGLIEYIQILSISDKEAPVLSVATVDECLNGNDCSAQKTFSVSAEDCLDSQVFSYSYELTNSTGLIKKGNEPSFSAEVSNMTYQVEWTVSDNCGNTASANVTYTFTDCKKPSPICYDGIASVIDANSGKAVVWASDLNQKSVDNCSVEEKLEFRVWHPALEGVTAKPGLDASGEEVLELPTSVELDCDYIGSQSVELYVIDEAGNWDYCAGSVLIQDGSGICGGGLIDSSDVAMLMGGIYTEGNVPLSGVRLYARGTVLFEQETTTDASGIFELDLPKGIGYIVSLDKEDQAVNGLTVFDIIKVTKHILGTGLFDTPYQYIAADVNQSGTVTTFDVVQMRRVILGIDDAFPGDRAWRFIHAAYDFNSDNPSGEAFSESVTIDLLDNNMSELDFVGVKLGDLNGSVQIDGLHSGDDRSSSVSEPLTIQDRKVRKGELIDVPVSMDHLTQYEGMQFTLLFKGLNLKGVQATVITAEHMVTDQPGQLPVCWDRFSSGSETGQKNKLFTISLEATSSGRLSEMIKLSGRQPAMAIGSSESIMNLPLRFIKSEKKEVPVLLQNNPNPFSGETTIGFYLPERQSIRLSVYNLQGAVVKSIQGTFDAGNQEIKIQGSDLKGSGILLYQLHTSQTVLSRKMILLD